jgi:NAD(P)-dependent dehydrogenase (short-subunit alcohol dehydrogenase family)
MAWTIENKRVVLTGASRGIGRTTALSLAKAGASLSLVVRDRALGEKVVEEIRALGAKGATDVFVADLSSQKEIRRVAAEIVGKHDVLDVLVNNAGAIFMSRELTVDGLERTFATNHLGYFLLTKLLLPALEKAPQARIVNVASAAHRRATLDFGDLMTERGYRGMKAYGRSKLANILFTRALAKRLEGTNITANCLHPGVVATGFGLNNPVFGFFVRIAQPFMMSDEGGAKTTVHLVTSPDVEGVNGKYFSDSKETTPSHAARDDEAADRLWAVSEELVGGSS